MPSYWAMLELVAFLQLLLSAFLTAIVVKYARGPVGARLAVLSILLFLEALLGLLIYRRWEELGYGPDISGPLLVIQTVSLAGTIIILDIVRR